MSLKTQLIRRIQESGPLSVAEYMAECNSHYYGTRDPFGAEGDFTTSPEISQIFGELIGAWMADRWQQQTAPRAVLCELGPGRGTLMKDLLRATRGISLPPQGGGQEGGAISNILANNAPTPPSPYGGGRNFHAAIDIRLVENSPKLRALQQKNLHDAHPRLSWHDSLEHLPPLPLFLIANEFFDALPVQQYIKASNGWQERKVDYNGKALAFMPEGKVIAEASPASTDLMARIAAHIHAHGGAALIIDYGHSGKKQGDTLQAIEKHQYADPLAHPGEADLTAHVDFGALLHTAKGRGAQGSGPVEQGTFLKRLGAELRATALCKNASPEQQKEILSGLERIVAPQAMGDLFKVIAVTSSLDKSAGF